MDEAFWTLALQVLEKGGPFALVVFLIVGGIIWLQIRLGKPASSGIEAQLTGALESLKGQMKENQDANERHHETAEKHREDMKDSIAALAERVARMEGMMQGRK